VAASFFAALAHPDPEYADSCYRNAVAAKEAASVGCADLWRAKAAIKNGGTLLRPALKIYEKTPGPESAQPNFIRQDLSPR